MTEVADQYIKAELLLPRGDELARGHVVAQSCNASGNFMGRDNAYSILDTKIYQVEFAWGDIKELRQCHC